MFTDLDAKKCPWRIECFMRYLIVGGTSIFGEGLINRLLDKENTELITATKLSDEEKIPIPESRSLYWVNLDLRDGDATDRVVDEAKADIIFDLATQDSVGFSWSHPTDTVDINIVGTINLLNAMRDYSKNARLVIGGSGEEYGRINFSQLPITEDSNPNPDNIYGATKACQTMFAKLYHQAYGLDVVVLRTFYETGTKQDENFAVSSFCKQFALVEAEKAEPVIRVGNLNNIRDLTDINDLVRAFDAIAEKGKDGEVYNAGRGEYTTLLDVIKILENITGIKVKIKMEADRVRPMDSPAAVADVKKIYKDCGWKAEISMEQTIEKLLNTWRDRISNDADAILDCKI